MKPSISFLAMLILAAVARSSSTSTLSPTSQAADSGSKTQNIKLPIDGKFILFDNFYGTPMLDDSALGLMPSRLVFVPGKLPNYNSYPKEAEFKKSVLKALNGAAVLANQSGPAPMIAGRPAPANAFIFLDLEGCALSPNGTRVTKEMVDKDLKMTLDYVRWTREAAPGHPVAFYGHGLFPEEPMNNEMKKQLADAVDAFCPEGYYSRFRDKTKWTAMISKLVKEGHAYGKPVYVYYWHHYSMVDKDKVKHSGLPLPDGITTFELETAMKTCGADGMVLWGVGPANGQTKAWWQETLKFIKELPDEKRALRLGTPEQFDAAAKVLSQPEIKQP